MNDQSLTTRIEGKIDKTTTSELSLGKNGSLAYANLNEIMEVAKVVAISQVAIPAHLRDNVGACLAICIQASEWQMSPFSVANKSYVVNNRLAYEAQLVNAVILRRAPIVGRFKISYSGDGEKRRCKVAVKLEDGEMVDYESPEVGKIPVKNSPLWKGDPDQQLFFYSSRAMCRRHFPDVLLGIYTQDEMAEETMRDVTERPAPIFTQEPALPAPKPEVDPAVFHKQPAPEKKRPAPAPEPEPVSTAPEPPAVGTSADEGAAGGSDKTALLQTITDLRDEHGIGPKAIREWAFKNALCASAALALKEYEVESLQAIIDRVDEWKGETA